LGESVQMATVAAELARRRAAAAGLWALTEELVLIGAGDPIPVPGRGDRTYPFMAHSEYYYLTDRNRPGGVLALDPHDGWSDFVAPVTESDRLWSGAPSGDLGGLPLPELAGWLRPRSGRRVAWLGVPPPGSSSDWDLSAELRFALERVRRPKDQVELQRMRIAERATSAAFAAAATLLHDGTSERAVQIELEAAALRHGADAMAYDTIVGAGGNSAVLHMQPTSRVMRSGELVLIDAGGEYRGYASDITRTYPVGRQLTAEQQELHSLVRAAELAAIDRCAPGTEWVEVHMTAAQVIAEGLIALGILRGEPTALIESGAAWLFFPHGIGHLVGLGVRDATGPLRERREHPPRVPNLRIDLPLEAGFVVTVEPGIYFVPALLEDPERRRRHRDEVAWDRVDRMLGFGGIRIEDNVLITDDGHEVLTEDVPLLG
jgi:Xaa-Pro aminopeptidase